MTIQGTIFCACIFTITHLSAQNIVPNPSFEEHTDCPNTNGQIHDALPWVRVLGSPDYYHECGTNGWSIPVSWGGGGDPNSGQAYIGIAVWAKTIQNGREFFSTKLTEPLIPSKKYNVEFYVSLMDSMWYATRNIGAYFSIDSIGNQMSSSFFFSKIPQIRYTGTDYLTDKQGWMKIEGSFFADGGERFITIGNFDDDDNTDTLLVSPVTSGGMIKTDAYYYIDDVSVELDTLTGLEEYEKVKFEIYPNPARNRITVETEKINNKTNLQVYDITGRVVLSFALTNTKTVIDISQLPTGVYVAALLQDEAIASRRKIIIE